MFHSKTLFIVGAGASREAGLPTGAELKEKIASAIDIRFEDGFRQSHGDAVVAQALNVHVTRERSKYHGNINPFLAAAWKVRDAMPQALSIDNFIDAHRHDETVEIVGKLGIARCILEAERNSSIYIDPREGGNIKFKSISSTWYSMFFQLVTESVSLDALEGLFDNISFLTFNYDRCIEHFLVQAIKNYYGVDDNTAQAVVAKLPIIHPYGQVGFLPWQAASPGINRVEFGGPVHENGQKLLGLSSLLRTFTERIEDQDALQNMRKCVQEAETIVFLGFAFHPTNLDLISPETRGRAKRVFGTAKGMSDSDSKAVTDDLPDWLKLDHSEVEIELRNKLTCAELFAEFWRSMPRAIK